MNLTVKQEKFCNNIVSGMSYKDSYMDAYNSESVQAAYIESSKLMMREDIQNRIKDLRKPIEEHIQNTAISEKEKQLEFIRSRMEHCKKKEDETSLLRWSDQYNKLLGFYKDAEETKDTDNNLTNINTDLLAKIAKIG